MSSFHATPIFFELNLFLIEALYHTLESIESIESVANQDSLNPPRAEIQLNLNSASSLKRIQCNTGPCRDESIDQLLEGILLGHLPFFISNKARFPTIFQSIQ